MSGSRRHFSSLTCLQVSHDPSSEQMKRGVEAAHGGSRVPACTPWRPPGKWTSGSTELGQGPRLKGSSVFPTLNHFLTPNHSPRLSTRLQRPGMAGKCRTGTGWGASLVVQWLRLCAPNAWGPSSIPGQEARLHVPQLKIPRATSKTGCSQTHKYLKKIIKRK